MAPSEPVPAGPSGQTADAGKKAMWQQRYRDALSRVAYLEAEIKRLEGVAAGLEQQFIPVVIVD